MQSAPSVQNAPTRPSAFAMHSTQTVQSSPSMQNTPQRSSLFARPKQVIHRYEEVVIFNLFSFIKLALAVMKRRFYI